MADIASAAAEAATVRKATADETPRVASALAKAFYDDPQARWVLRHDGRRMAGLESGYDFGLRKLWGPQDEVYTTDGVVGAAVWMKPGQARLSAVTQARLTP